MRYNVVTNFYKSEVEQMRMSIFVSAKTRQEALIKGAKVYCPDYEYVEPRKWFREDRAWSQAAFRLGKEQKGLPSELLVAVRKWG